MNPLDLEPPVLVEDEKGMARLLEDLGGQTEIAVDTEADSFYSYREKVCLVQITVEDRDYLVDPLADLDVRALGPIFADPTKIKIFHDSEYDVLILKRDFDFEFAGLFDTRVAAAALGKSSPGLASVLSDYFDVELDKSQQRSDWAKRPLSEKQIRYARLDTHFLLPLMGKIIPELEARGRMMIVEGECRRLEHLTPPESAFRPDDFVRIKGVRLLRPAERRALRELFTLREGMAEAADVPPFRVMNNQVMIELARVRPTNLRDLGHVHGFSARMVRKMGDDVLDRLEDAAELEPIERLPVLPKRDGTEGMSELQSELYDRLKRWRKGVSEEHGIESSYLLNRHVMARIAREQPNGVKGLAGIDGMLPWQLDMFGEGLAKLLSEFERAVKAGEVPEKKPWRRGKASERKRS